MTQRNKIVLLTGFGPFPNVSDNASSALAGRLAGDAAQTFPDATFHAEILPTEWVGAPARLGELLDEIKPALVLHFGVSAKARGFEVETTATNAVCRSPDAAGAVPRIERLRENGAASLRSQLPAQAIVKRLLQRGLPARVSNNAGVYICNAVLYQSLVHAGQCGHDMGAGFIHLPDCLAKDGSARPSDHGGNTVGCPLDWPCAITGGLEIIAACLGRPSPDDPVA